MQVKQFTKKMSDGFELSCCRWLPDGERDDIKGVVQLHHGLAEHAMRYDRFGTFLAENGYVLNAYDMRGHGRTAANAEANGTGRFGMLAEKDGFDRVVEDLHEITTELRREYLGRKLVLFGHSFGSFVSQAYIERFGGELDGCVLCGTSGPKGGIVGLGLFLVRLVMAFRGKYSYVPLLEKLSFGSYNSRITDSSSDLAWLSRNEENIRLYEMDKWCGIKLTTSFYRDMLTGLTQIHAPDAMRQIPKDLPVLLIYGTEDPVGGWGELVKKLYDIYVANGMTDVQLKAYEGDRHEILNEADYAAVQDDVLRFLGACAV